MSETPSATRNDWEIRVFGLRRSGHHGVIVWLAAHYPRRSVFFINNVRAGRDPFASHSDTRRTTSRACCFLDRDEDRILHERRIPKHCLMYNYEDQVFSDETALGVEKRRSSWVGRSRRELDVLVLRDPFNLLASRWRLAQSSNSVSLSGSIDKWMNHAREFTGLTDYLGPKLPVNFNRWFASQPYRADLSQRLGRPFTDAGLQAVPANGNGSSWDGTNYDGRGQAMDVLNRWKCVAQEPDYARAFAGRSDVLAMSEMIFGPIDGTRRLCG